jgi:DNA-binding PadR family transcriptional regulator
MKATTLDYLLLGLLASGPPRSGYDLRKEISASPLRQYSDSPGAIYPALRRLVARGWLEAGPAEGGRGRRTFRVTRSGAAAFRTWLLAPVTMEDAATAGPELLLRFAFMSTELSGAQIRRFLDELEKQTSAYVGVVREQHGAIASRLSTTARLAFEHGISQFEARARWAAKARHSLSSEESRRRRRKTR